MKSNFIHYLAAATLGLSALMATGCQSEDDPGQTPQGTIPLAIGNVTIAGVETGGHTRAAITEDGNTGFTGLRKSRFVDGDRLFLTLTKPSADPASRAGEGSTEITATLTEGVWTLPEKVFVTPGTEISAAYAPDAASGQTYPDALTCATCTLEGQKVSFSMLHANAMLDITLPAGITPATVSVSATPTDGSQQTLGTAVEEESSGLHYRAIAAPGKVASVSIEYSGTTYVATLPSELTVEANKRYPIAINVKDMKFTASVGTSTPDWGKVEDINYIPKDYTRAIGTAEELALFAYEVNNDLNSARTAIVLQTADIDLSELQNSDAYEATAENWVPIGTTVLPFKGKYNGNGYTISNMKINNQAATEIPQGLFGTIDAAWLTGIHLRAVDIQNFSKECGALCGHVQIDVRTYSIITLCSATGKITLNSSAISGGILYMGGLLGKAGPAFYSRCSAGVNLDATPLVEGEIHIGGFAGTMEVSSCSACLSTGNIYCSLTDNCGGFVGSAPSTAMQPVSIFGCYADGESVAGINAFIGIKPNTTQIYSCYARMSNASDFGPQSTTYKNCVYYGDATNSGENVTPTTDASAFYGTLVGYTTPFMNRTLHWSAEDGYTLALTVGNLNASGIWIDNNSELPTINITYEREIAAN